MENKRLYKYRLGEERFNNQGCLMRIVEYNKANDIIVEFQDKYKGKIHTNYKAFLKKEVKNPYHTSIFGVGITGDKYQTWITDKKCHTKEYNAWVGMLQRCFYKKEKQREPTYKDATCCQEWLYYPNFHEWLHSQENFDKWYNGEQWAVDKDIFMKGNKTYSPDTCCLVPYNVNNLFTKHDNARGIYPIGVHWHSRDNMFTAQCMNPFTKKRKFLGYHETINDAFQAYKKYKESIIKQVADVEYSKRNITKKCYDAMMNYEVEITD